MEDDELTRYGDWAPTSFDHAGAFLSDRQDWVVAPVGQSRDSEPLEQSNFACALEMLGGESETVEVHRFGHWGPGWVEIILVDPTDAARVETVKDMQSALANYPVLNEEDFSRREWEESEQDWENWARKDFIAQLEKDFGLSDRAVVLLEGCDPGRLRQWCDEHSSEYCPINLRSFRCERGELAALLRELRAD